MNEIPKLPKEIVVGMDWATNRVHFTILDMDGNLLHCDEVMVKMSIKPDARRIVLCEAFLALLRGIEGSGVQVLHLGVEAPISPRGRSAKGIRSLCMTVGALHLTASSVPCVDWEWVEVSKWKYFVGKVAGKTTKEVAKDYFIAHFANKTTKLDQDINKLHEDHYDAGCIALYHHKNLINKQKRAKKP